MRRAKNQASPRRVSAVPINATKDMYQEIQRIASQNRLPKLNKVLIAPFHMHKAMIDAIDAAAVKERLGVPGNIEVVAVIVLGYPGEELRKEDKPRKALSEIIHYGRW